MVGVAVGGSGVAVGGAGVGVALGVRVGTSVAVVVGKGVGVSVGIGVKVGIGEGVGLGKVANLRGVAVGVAVNSGWPRASHSVTPEPSAVKVVAKQNPIERMATRTRINPECFFFKVISMFEWSTLGPLYYRLSP